VLKIFYAAELVGKAGVHAFKNCFPVLLSRQDQRFDFVIAGGDSVTGGIGIGRNHAGYLHKLGCDCITCGDNAFNKKDLVENIERMPYLLRPYNFSSGAPGRGYKIFKTRGGEKVAVIVMQGQINFAKKNCSNPYEQIKDVLATVAKETKNIFIDFHAEASGEKYIFFNAVAGLCSAVIGSHTRVQSKDERIERGTAFISCAGRSGVVNSVGGLDAAANITQYLNGIPQWAKEAEGDAELQGVIITIDDAGLATAIERVKLAAE
jgi:metallophosphoesterase (TIGR00282 family)